MEKNLEKYIIKKIKEVLKHNEYGIYEKVCLIQGYLTAYDKGSYYLEDI